MEPAFRSFGRQQFNRALSAARLPQAETAVHLAAELAGERLDFGEASRDFEKQQAKRSRHLPSCSFHAFSPASIRPGWIGGHACGLAETPSRHHV
jgi:hypothetical protein